MKRWVIDHLASVALVLVAFAVLFAITRKEETPATSQQRELIAPYLSLKALDAADPLHRALLTETFSVFYPDSPERADTLLRALDANREEQFTTLALKTGVEAPGLTWAKAARLAPMYLNFLLVYVIVLALTYYGAHTAGVYRFVRMKQRRDPPLREFRRRFSSALSDRSGRSRAKQLLSALPYLGAALLKGVAYALLFAPSYVIAYSFKTNIETDSYLVMVLLAVISNGLLVSYANKFTTLLVHESRKGYVETAMVKNLHSSYAWNRPEGISVSAVLSFRKRFPSHVFGHVYSNAHFQYIRTVKEQAAFVVTGLVIIEMALNIQNHLCYELLQTVLYKDYAVAAAIIFAIFLAVKGTEIGVDGWFRHEAKKYDYPVDGQ